MSKGHQAHRRRSYGRRQHDVRERSERRQFESRSLELDDEQPARDAFAFDDRHRVAQLAIGG